MSEKTDTFDPSFFEKLKLAENKYFWFRVRRHYIFDRINKFSPPPAKLLEIGCGTGNVCSFLSKKGYEVTGCEFYDEAIKISWPGYVKVRGDACALKFENNSYDIVCLFDVIEHFDDDVQTLKEAIRVLKQGGILAITVPAREELWSHFDKESHHKRRYTKEGLNHILLDLKVKPLLIDYIFMFLYLPMKYMRNKDATNNDPFRINPFLNSFLLRLLNLERIISKRIPLPIGTSLIAVALKEEK